MTPARRSGVTPRSQALLRAALAAMRRHVGAEAVQDAAITCLLWLFDDKDVENNIMAEHMGKAGSVETLLAAQSRHRGSVDIQGEACRLLYFLFIESEENLARALSAGIVEAVLVAMRTHMLNVQVQQEASAVLNVVTNPELNNVELTIQLADMGAAETVVAAMHTHVTDTWVQRNGCQVLRAMSSGNAQTMTQVRRAGAIKAAEAAIKAHSRKKSVVKEARKLLRTVRTGARVEVYSQAVRASTRAARQERQAKVDTSQKHRSIRKCV
mmetsp:Transcript_13297/g.21599  ORF Transcript_13297/g.21599 Transcript_13297/m.21599 type:complete len:269 (-) Transcript_13297:495-1301(-)